MLGKSSLPADRLFVRALTALGVLYLAFFVYYFLAAMIRRPYWDMFMYVTDYLTYADRGDFFQYLWSQYFHWEHRETWNRLLTAADVGIFRGTGYPFIIADTMCVLAVAGLLAIEVVRCDLPTPVSRTAVWLVLLLIFTSVNAADCSVAIEGIYPQTMFFAVLSLVLLDGASEGGRYGFSRRFGALGTAIGAGLSCGLGLVLWPILIWAAWRGRLGPVWLAGIAACGAAFVGLYLHGLSINDAALSESHGRAGFLSTTHLLQTADALLTFLGLPWTRAQALAVPGRLIGACLLLAGSAAAVWIGLLRPQLRRFERIAVGLILFSFAAAAAAALGRAGASGILPLRYSLLLAPLHIGLLLLALPWVKDRWYVKSGRRWLQIGVASLGGLLLVQQFAAGEYVAAKARSINAAIADFAAGQRDPALAQFVYPDLSYAQQVAKELHRRGLFVGLI